MTEEADKDLAQQEPSTISSPSQDAEDSSSLSMIAHMEEIRGPLPPPHILAQYDEIQPGFADRIVIMAENQSLHRQQSEKLVIEAGIADDESQRSETFIGQLFGLIISALIIISAAVVVCLHPTWQGATFGSLIGGGDIVALVYAFRYTNQAENADKTKPKAE